MKFFARPAPYRRAASLPVALTLELLEPRYLLSANINLDPATGIVTISGSSSADQAFVDMASAQSVRFTLNVNEIEHFNLSAINRVDFIGQAGADVFMNRTQIESRGLGGDGNDSLSGGYQDDFLWGGAGNDFLSGRGGVDVLKGDVGNDELWGGSGSDQLWGEEGDDVAYGEAGNDLIYGSDGDDTLRGEVGIDSIRGGLGNDRIFGGDNSDSLMGEEGYDTVHGEGGNDAVWGGTNNDYLSGGDGNDKLRGDDGFDEHHGGAGNDSIWGSTGEDQIFGDDGDDVLSGGLNDDLVRGGTGNDALYGDEGNDHLSGEAGEDRLFGGVGNDGLLGGADYVDDYMVGNGGFDRFLIVGSDGVADYANVDAKLFFIRGDTNWTTREIEVLDVGFQALYELTGNTRLLRDPLDTTGLKIRKYSWLSGGSISINRLHSQTINGHTTYTRHIDVRDWNENDESDNEMMTTTMVHEVGHSWDSTKEIGTVAPGSTGIWTSFLKKSGWTQTRPGNLGLYHRSLDGQWWYLKTAEFAREYGRANPYEDWSTVWEQNVFQLNKSAGANLRAKVATAQSLFDALAVHG